MSLDGNDWFILTGPPAPSVLPWDSGWVGSCDYQLPTNITVSAGGGSDLLSLTTQGSKCGWRVDSQDDWITATVTHSSFAWPANGFVGSGNGDVSYSIEPNPSTNPRVGTFTVGPVTVTVTQAGVNCTPSLSPGGESIGDQADDHPFSVQVPAACQWTATTSDPWISIVSGGSGAGNGSVTYRVTENNGPTVRSGAINVGGAVFSILQAREVCRTTLTPTTRTMPAESGSDTLTVSSTFADCNWTATSSQPWITIPGANGAGSGTLGYTVAVNNSPNPRFGTIAIGEAETTITQSACTIQVDFVPGTAAPGESTGQVTLEVRATRIGGTTLCREVRVPYTFVGADAIPNLDYQDTPGEVVFAAGASSPATRPVTVLIINDGVAEGAPERFDIVLSTPVGATVVAPGRRTISIIEDNLEPGTDALGDYDGDGISDPAVFRPSTQTWDVRGKFVVQFGQPGDLPVPGDYNGDGSTDVAVYRPSTGQWLVRNQSTRQLGAPGDIPVPADYDGDGDTDVAVYRLSTRQWLVLDKPAVQFGDPGDVPVPGDYNDDGESDIAVYRPSTGFWYVRNQSAVQYGGPGEVPVAADYDGDGRTDIAVYRPASGLWRVRNQFEVQYGDAGDIPVPRDYDGDGRADIAVYSLATSFWHIRHQIPVQHGQILDLPAPGAPLGPRAVAADYDGNRTTDIAVYRPSTHQWFVRNGVAVLHGDADVVPVPADYNGDGTIDPAFYHPPTGRWSIHGRFDAYLGQPGDIPVPGDYNGDGATDLAVYRPSTGTWLLNGQPDVQLGTAGDRPVPGDYNGDGVTDMAVYTPSTGTWRIRNQPTVQYGDPGDVPVPADYNGDGVTDIAVFRAIGGMWYVRNQAALQIGDPGDIPAPGDYNGDGILDAAVFRPSTRIWYVRNQTPVQYGDPGDVPLTVIRQP